MKVAAIILAAALGYFLGSLNFSIIVFQFMKGKDIRTMGSRNAGLTNAYRCGGPSCAAMTLVGDLGKGIVAVALAIMFAKLMKAGLTPDNDAHYVGYIAGFFAIIGHVFPVYYHFRGGKGVLVGVSAFVVLEPKVFLALIIVFSVMLALSKYVSFSSIVSTAYAPIAIFLMSAIVDDAGLGRSFLYMVMSIPMAAVIIFMHRSNIQRLLEGTESKFTFKTSGK